MLNDETYVKDSLINNLFYLRNIRRYARNLELAFLPKNKEYMEVAASFALKSEDLEEELIKLADNRLSNQVLKGGIFTTEYTIPLENQTIELFGTPINVNISRMENALNPGDVKNPDKDVISKIDELNKKSLSLAESFSRFTTDLYNKETSGKLFSYSDPFLINFMMEETNLYIKTLKRLINRQTVDPTFATDYEYGNNKAIRDIAVLLRSYIGPSREDIFIKAQSFVKEYDALLTRYKQSELNPDIQEELTKQSKVLLNRFIEFLKYVIKELLNFKAYFIIEPIFLDNLLTNLNYFKYILEYDEKEERHYWENDYAYR